MSELQGEVSRLLAEKEELEKELDTQTNHTHQQVSGVLLTAQRTATCTAAHCSCSHPPFQVSALQSQVQTSEALLQDLQKSFSQSQTAVQSRLVSHVIT